MNTTTDTSHADRAEVSSAASALRREIEASTRALSEAEDAYVQEAMRDVRWERSGPLRRLRRSR